MDRLHLAEGLLLVGVEQHKHDHQQQLEKETDKPENILLSFIVKNKLPTH